MFNVKGEIRVVGITVLPGRFRGYRCHVADFQVKSSIFHALGSPGRTRKRGPRAGSPAGWQTAPMKSATVELGAYARLRAAPLLDAGTDPAHPGRHACRPALAARPADGLIRKLAGPRRPAITPG